MAGQDDERSGKRGLMTQTPNQTLMVDCIGCGGGRMNPVGIYTSCHECAHKLGLTHYYGMSQSPNQKGIEEGI